MRLVSEGTLLELLILFLVVLAVLTVVLRRQRHRTWRPFARRCDFVFHRESNGHPVVIGEIDGHPCRLAISTESSGTGIAGVEVIEGSLHTLLETSRRLEALDQPPSIA